MGAGDGVGVAGEQASHLLGRLKMAVGEALAFEPGGVDGAALADTGHDVLQDAALWVMKQDVAGGDEGNAGGGGQGGEAVDAGGIAGSAADGGGKVGAARGVGGQTGELDADGGELVGNQDVEQAVAALLQVGPIQVATALAGAPLTLGQQAAQAGPGGAVGRIGEQDSAVAQRQAAAGDEADLGGLGGLPAADDAGHRVVVNDAEGGDAVSLGLREQLLRVACTAEEAVIGGDLEFGVGHELF